MKYNCGVCPYKTNDKSNFNRHLNSKSHPLSSDSIVEDDKTSQSKYVCSICNKSFASRQGLSRHKLNVCINQMPEEDSEDKDELSQEPIDNIDDSPANNNYKKETKQINDKLNDLSSQVNILIQMLNVNAQNNIIPTTAVTTPVTNIINANNNTVNNNKPTYNISVKNYASNTYPNAPALSIQSKSPEYSVLKYKNQKLMDTIIYNYDNNNLCKYFGDYIIKCYKKDNPAEQSMWTSDVSRLTYIISELLANNKSIWRHDYKGLKIKEYILIPLMNYIREYIEEYFESIDLKNIKKLSMEECNKQAQYQTKVMEISSLIDSNILIDEILKYITPYFCLIIDNNAKPIKHIETPKIDYFIDK